MLGLALFGFLWGWHCLDVKYDVIIIVGSGTRPEACRCVGVRVVHLFGAMYTTAHRWPPVPTSFCPVGKRNGSTLLAQSNRNPPTRAVERARSFAPGNDNTKKSTRHRGRADLHASELRLIPRNCTSATPQQPSSSPT